MKKNSRDNAREAFSAAGLTVEALTPEMLRDLRKMINDCMVSFGLIDGTLRMRASRGPKRNAGTLPAMLRCRSRYFDDREAVTFNRDGFVGIAGWADEENVVPIIEGFTQWVAAYRNARDTNSMQTRTAA